VRFHLRNYRPADLKTLWQIDQQCFEPGISYSAQEMRIYLSQPGAFAVVAEIADSSEIAGFLIGQVISGSRAVKPFGYVITIDVLTTAQRTGLGSLLLEASEQRMRQEGCCKIVLEVAVDNAPALAFYKRHGFQTVATHAGYYSNGTDAFEMEKPL